MMAQFGSLIVNGQTAFMGKTYAPTQPAGKNDETVATTAFVQTAIQNALNSNENNKTEDLKGEDK